MRRAVIIAVLLAAAAPATAQENSDLNLIPQAVQNAPEAKPESPPHGKYSVLDALGGYTYRGTLAVPATYGSAPSRWANRTSLDALDTWTLATDLTATFSDQLSATFADGVGFPNQVVRNDPRELYLTWEPLPETYVETGRINVRNGVAYGYNPTDFFRSRTTVAQASSDPSAQRVNRLGVVMLRAQRIFDGGAIDFVFAPKLHTPSRIGAIAGPFDPKFDQTNAADRIEASLSFELEDLSPQVLVYQESGRTQIGLNISHPIGSSIVAYLSWAGGEAPDLIVDAIAFGRRTRTIPDVAPLLPPTDTARRFENQVSLGASWSGEDKESVSIEYNYSQTGFSKRDWRNWFSTGANSMLAPEMWYIRGYAGDRQVPVSQHQAFARVDWYEPWNFEHFDINALVMTSLEDGSCFGQLAASYDISDNWSIGAFLGGTAGSARSEWGSLSSAASATIQVARYF